MFTISRNGAVIAVINATEVVFDIGLDNNAIAIFRTKDEDILIDCNTGKEVPYLETMEFKPRTALNATKKLKKIRPKKERPKPEPKPQPKPEPKPPKEEKDKKDDKKDDKKNKDEKSGDSKKK